jgi:MtN3 and saliva related transmembrane protein
LLWKVFGGSRQRLMSDRLDDQSLPRILVSMKCYCAALSQQPPRVFLHNDRDASLPLHPD